MRASHFVVVVPVLLVLILSVLVVHTGLCLDLWLPVVVLLDLTAFEGPLRGQTLSDIPVELLHRAGGVASVTATGHALLGLLPIHLSSRRIP